MPLTNCFPSRYISLNILLLCLLWSPVWAVDHIEIGDHRNNLYLPYGIDTAETSLVGPERAQVRFSLQTYKSAHGDKDTSILVKGTNPKPQEEATADFSAWFYPKKKYFFEYALKFTLSDFGLYHSLQSSYPGVVAVGYHNDTAFAVRILPKDSILTYIPLASGIDRDDDKVWRGRPQYVTACDYDNDGREEVFLWVDASRDLVPRALVCLDPDSQIIKWSVPVAPGVVRNQVVPLPDSVNPRIMFTAYAMGQGVVDSLFCSDVGYVGLIDAHGRVVDRKIASGFGRDIWISQIPGSTNVVMSHTFPLSESVADTVSYQSKFLVSIVDRDLNVLRTVELPDRMMRSWFYDYNGDGKLEIYTVTTIGVVRIFDQQLNLLAESSPSSLTGYSATLPAWGKVHDVFVMDTPRGLEIYSHNFEKLAALKDMEYVLPLGYNSQGDLMSFVAAGHGQTMYGEIILRSWYELVSIFYQDYQIWVLSILFSLAVGLIVMNLYRRRVSKQRQALATANSELARTHEALKQAQATIIAQEKYKQAKDMAGAFAHEIRNALFPADSALTKLVQLSDQPNADPDRILSLRESIRNSVTRAVSITEEISTYTKLDTLYSPETLSVTTLVADLIKGHSVMLEENNISFSSDGPADATVRANRAHLVVVLSNLFLNSIHALQGRPKGAIALNWRQSGAEVVIDFIDNGCGIPPEQIGRVFDAFFSTKATKGTGLGLATCKRIVEMYSGSISVQSKLGEGTQFTLHIPTGSSVAETGTSSLTTHRSRNDTK